MSDYDDGGHLDPGYTGNDQPEQLDPGYTGNDQPDVFGGHDFGHYESGHEHNALDQVHQDHGAESDVGQQFGVFEHDHAQAETSALEHGQHVEYRNGYDEGEQPSFANGSIDDLHDRLSGLAGEDNGGEAHLGVASS